MSGRVVDVTVVAVAVVELSPRSTVVAVVFAASVVVGCEAVDDACDTEAVVVASPTSKVPEHAARTTQPVTMSSTRRKAIAIPAILSPTANPEQLQLRESPATRTPRHARGASAAMRPSLRGV